MSEIATQDGELFSEISRLIRESHNRVSIAVNAEMTELYWQVGNAINQKVLGGERAEYGADVVKRLSRRLTEAYGRGWSAQQLRHCMRLASVFPHDEKFSALRRELSWTAVKTLMYIENPVERDFYAEMCKLNHWSSRTLNGRIKSMLFERTAISKKPEETIENDLAQLRETGEVSEELVFRDPYFLDYLDLLFFHRRLRRLVAIELKLGKFEAAYKGQMELYLRWLEKHERVEGENTPIGLILCSGKNDEHIELMGLDEGSIRVAEYLTQLPERKLLEEKLRLSVERARQRISAANIEQG